MGAFRQVEKQDAENQINGQKLHALEPIRFAIAVDLKNQMHRNHHRNDLGQCKFQVHWPAQKIRGKDEHRRDKKRDLLTRSHGNREAEAHLVFYCHHYRRRVLRGITDHGDHNDPDKYFGKSQRRSGGLYRADQKLGH